VGRSCGERKETLIKNEFQEELVVIMILCVNVNINRFITDFV